jgi:hypothetical protein
METPIQVGPATVVDVQTTGVSWAAIAAGAVTAAALSLMLIALGVGLGLSAVSPWSGSGVSGMTFKLGTGVYLVATACIASSAGGYLAARLRTKWLGLHTNEVFFRDTAHGLITWAFATVLSAAVLGSAVNNIVGGASQALGAVGSQAAAQASPINAAVDTLFRADPAVQPNPPQQGGETAPVRTELFRLLTTSLGDGGDLSADDRAYLTGVVAARTGLSQADAEKRVVEVVNGTKQALDSARKSAAQLSLWLAAALLMGAFASSLGAVEGGQLRDGTWDERKLTSRALSKPMTQRRP